MKKLFFLLLFCAFQFLSCTNNKESSKDNPVPEPDPFWKSDKPLEAGLSTEFLYNLESKAATLPNLYSFVLAIDNSVLVEKYYNGADRESLLHIRSVTKSISAILTGIAIDKGLITGTDERLQKYFPEHISDTSDEKLKKLNIQHILDMQTGFDWDEFVDAFPYFSADDGVAFLFAKDIAHEPGKIFNYNTAASHLISPILKQATGLDESKFAEQNLFAPLGISKYEWEKDRRGFTRADFGLQMRAIDLAKIGYVFNHNGYFEDTQIYSTQWNDKLGEYKFSVTPWVVKLENNQYGNLWWKGEYRSLKVIFGLGYGGQFLVCVPELDLVCVVNHKWDVPGNVAGEHSSNFIQQLLVPVLDELLK